MKTFLSVLILLIALKTNAQTETNFYTQGNNNRTAAEWEPALGTMITWPLCVPYKLVIELAKDNHLFTLIENDSAKAEAIKWYTKWGIDSSKNTFVQAPKGIDSWWVRDWGPGAVFTPEGKMKLADGKYIYATPVTNIRCDDSLHFIYKTADNKIIKTETDDNATVPIGKGLSLEVLDLPFINTGGNLLTDGLGTAFSTCVLLNENKFYGVEPNQFLQLNKNLAGFNSYNIISNFEKNGIQHIDCLLKILDEERILVTEPPADHELYPVYENIVKNELSKLTSVYGRPYEILRIKTQRYKEQALAAYTNSIIINKTIYVPLFQIKEDSLALQKWREVMPGYVVKGFEYSLADEPYVDQKVKEHYRTYGWNFGDALHCRTRAVWDPEMLFISTKRIDYQIDAQHAAKVYTTIIDYSGRGLEKNKTKLIWRIAGAKTWNTIMLEQEDDINHFSAQIPVQKSGTTIEYFVSAISKSGKTETHPRTAPLGTYQFLVK